MRRSSSIAVAALVVACGGGMHERGGDVRPGVATIHAGTLEAAGVSTEKGTDAPERADAVGGDVVRGEPMRKTEGELALYVPDAIRLRDGRFDLLVHFHGVPEAQEANVEEADLHAVVVSVNAGVGTTAYARRFSADDSFDRVIAFAEREVAAGRGREEARAGRIALSSWSAGGAAVRGILERDADRIDAVLAADGVFSRYADPVKHTIEPKPLEPLVAFARRAMNGEKLLVVTHTAIDASQYPSVAECTAVILDTLGISKEPPSADLRPAGGNPTYAVARGSFFVRGYDGKKPGDHGAQIAALDAAYALLGERWAR